MEVCPVIAVLIIIDIGALGRAHSYPPFSLSSAARVFLKGLQIRANDVFLFREMDSIVGGVSVHRSLYCPDS